MALDVKQHVIQTTVKRFEESLQHMYNLGFDEGKKSVQKTGQWIDVVKKEPVEIDYSGCPKHSCNCSVCGEWLVASDEYPVKGRFCPSCGAKMTNAICDDDCEHCDLGNMSKRRRW